MKNILKEKFKGSFKSTYKALFPELVDYIIDNWFSYYPLWSAEILKIFGMLRDSTSDVENWYNILKNNLDEGESKMSAPRFFEKNKKDSKQDQNYDANRENDEKCTEEKLRDQEDEQNERWAETLHKIMEPEEINAKELTETIEPEESETEESTEIIKPEKSEECQECILFNKKNEMNRFNCEENKNDQRLAN